jgi:hypothetical protein
VIKIGERAVSNARYVVFQLDEVAAWQGLLRSILGKINQIGSVVHGTA